MSYQRAPVRQLFATAVRRMQGLLRRPPKRKKTSSGVKLSWQVAEVKVELEHEERTTGGGPGLSEYFVWLRFSPTDKYRAPPTTKRWKHPARRRRVFGWHKGKPLVYHPDSLVIGQPLAQVQRHLKAKKRKFERLTTLDYRVRRILGTDKIDPKRPVYSCEVSPLGGPPQSGYCSFDKGKLSNVTVTLSTSNIEYDLWIGLQQLYAQLTRRLGTLPTTTSDAMTWKTRDHQVSVTSYKEYEGAGSFRHHIMLSVDSH